MKRREPEKPEPTLFDLPLREEGEPEIELDLPPSPRGATPPAAALDPGTHRSEPHPHPLANERSGPVLVPPPRAVAAGFGRRLWAALANLAVELALLIALVAGSSWMVGEPRLA
ncbi:MAG: hypothetical protein ACM3OB_07925 [Acidobacteriota bacterium]